MSKYLVVVESPAKAKTINKFLGSNYSVKASNGHVRDLPPNELGVDVEHDFTPTYKQISRSAKAVKELKSAARQAERVLVASDPDREGEAIGWHVAEILKSYGKPIERIVFNAITKRNVIEATQHPRAIDLNLVNAQQARRILDRLVGYKISPLLQFGVRKGLSAGRVQSVAVRMVCEREAEIRAFVPEEYWSLDATLETDRKETFVARLFRIGQEKAKVSNEETVRKILQDLHDARYRVANVERKEVQRRPRPPFITSSLQQEASRRLGFSPHRTMRIAQRLYEGVALGAEGTAGVITYMRTDSTRIDGEAIQEVREYIHTNFEPAMLPDTPNLYASKKGAQDAHEAIRPTSVLRTPDALKPHLDADQLKLYTLVWKRFVASQMAPAILDQMTIDVRASEYVFRATGSLVKFPGFTKLYEESKEDDANEKEGAAALPDVAPEEPVTAKELKPEQHFTKPPPRYSEASLVRALEENGIGRPSTYAPTLRTIQERGYVEREKRRLKPTPLGEEVNTLLVHDFPDILDINFTARLEGDLDDVEEGKQEWHDLLRAFYVDFSKTLGAAQHRIMHEALGDDSKCPKCGADFELREGRYGLFIACKDYPTCKTTRRIGGRKAEPTNEVCERCGAPMVIRDGRFGRFMSCSTYPKCKNTFSIDEQGNKIEKPAKEPPKKTDQKCPKCGGFLLIRKSRTGEEFYGCEKYPKCKFTKPMELGLKCLRPGCDGNLVIKRAKRSRFIGCDKYPECDFAVFGRLDRETPCPKCGNSWTTIVKQRNKPRQRLCPVPNCAHTEDLPEDDM